MPAVVVLVLLVVWAAQQWRGELATRDGGEAGASAVAAGEARLLEARVTRVVDGDTLHVELPGSITPSEKVRLLRIDTPERGEPGYEQASAALVALAAGRDVALSFEDPDAPARDDYGRLLAYVWIDGRCANVELVRRGFSPFVTRWGEGRLAAAFRAAQDEARARDAGLWSAGEWNAAARAGRR